MKFQKHIVCHWCHRVSETERFQTNFTADPLILFLIDLLNRAVHELFINETYVKTRVEINCKKPETH